MLGSTWFCWVPLGSAGFRPVLGYARLFWILLGSAVLCLVLFGSAVFYCVLYSAWFCLVFCWVLLAFAQERDVKRDVLSGPLLNQV